MKLVYLFACVMCDIIVPMKRAKLISILKWVGIHDVKERRRLGGVFMMACRPPGSDDSRDLMLGGSAD